MYISGYVKDDIYNGEGVRDVLFFSGCTHGCKGCHNTDTHNSIFGREFTAEMQNKVLRNVKSKTSDMWNITLSGGDPLFKPNRSEMLRFIQRLKDEDINVWLYTGYMLHEIPEAFLYEVDVIVDGKYIEELKASNLPFKGSSNQKILYKGVDY